MCMNFEKLYEKKDEVGVILKDLSNIAEPSFKEYKTTEYITNFLEKHGIPIDKKFETGCFGTINTGSKRTIALRADIDALPVDAENTKFAHLCGHHGHTAALLLALKELIKNKKELNCNIRYIFQPAEETGSGALFLIDKGVLENVDEIYALHGDPNNRLGTVAIKSGELMAGSSLFKISISGYGTHAAFPHKGCDVVIAISELINLCQKIISRFKNPTKEGVISFCKINGGTAANILPSEIVAEGTFRFFEEEVKNLIINKMKRALKSVEEFYNVKTDFQITKGTLPLINDKKLCNKLIKKFSFNKFKIVEDYEKMMGSEDFSYFLEKVPGVYLKVGIALSNNHPPLHNKNFFLPVEAVLHYVYLFMQLACVT